jgi:hypothetical protein
MTVHPLGPLARHVHPIARPAARGRLLGQGYPLDRDPNVTRAYSAEVNRRLKSLQCDLVFSPASIPIAYLEAGPPLAMWTGTTFAAMLHFYPDYVSLSKRAVRVGLDLDSRALERASVAFYASDWAARSAVEDHGVDPHKVEVVPYRANMPITHTRDAVAKIVHQRPADRCRLLFVGLDWTRKGGKRAVEVARLLNERGLPTELHIVGAAPEPKPICRLRSTSTDSSTSRPRRVLRRCGDYSRPHTSSSNR